MGKLQDLINKNKTKMEKPQEEIIPSEKLQEKTEEVLETKPISISNIGSMSFEDLKADNHQEYVPNQKRKMPEIVSDELLEFVRQMDSLEELKQDGEIAEQVVMSLARQLQLNPEFEDQLIDTDVKNIFSIMISRGKLNRIIAEEKQVKKTAASTKRADKKAAVNKLMKDITADLGDDFL